MKTSEQKETSLFKRIKKQNSEAFAQALQRHGLLEVPQLLQMLRHAGKITDVEQMIGFLKSLLSNKDEIEMSYFMKILDENPHPLNDQIKEALQKQDAQTFVYKLLEKAGYYAYVVDTLEKQNAIKPFFKSEESLCTFDDHTRFIEYHSIHLIKKELIKDEAAFRKALEENDYEALKTCFEAAKDVIPRGNPPDRQDAYGVSVMPIQLRRGYISIKNRYNHNVPGCDNTFDSDPDQIIPGLSLGLKLLFGVDFKKHFLPMNFRYIQGNIVQIYTEKDDVFFGHNCYIHDSELFPIDPDYQVIVEEMIIDKKNNTITSPLKIPSLLTQVIEQEFKGKKIQEKKLSSGEKVLFADDTPIITFKEGQITHLNLPTVKNLKEGTLANLKELQSVTAPNLTYAHRYNFFHCPKLTEVNVPKLKKIGDNCFYRYKGNVDAPELEEAGEVCFVGCFHVHLPKLKKAAQGCFKMCYGKINLPSLVEVGNNSFVHCLDEVNVPELKEIVLMSSVAYLRATTFQKTVPYEGCFLDTDKRNVYAPFILGQTGRVVAYQHTSLEDKQKTTEG